jgi:cellulose synthase/poly-beta-1,6-N-acetylglucosamine synthase-like glycosyltransferase
MTFFIILVLLGIATFSLATWMIPLLAATLTFPSRSNKANITSVVPRGGSNLDILIPAHFEPTTLPFTLKSVRNACDNSQDVFATPPRIFVALNAWSEPAAFEAASAADHVIEVPTRGKWFALMELIAKSEAEWVALVDAGISWPDSLLKDLQGDFSNQELIGINPKYSQGRNEQAQNLIWSFESVLKRFENLAGGPVSVHGATVFYRRQALQKALEKLSPISWLNDDVAIPLCMRCVHPKKRIRYAGEVQVWEGLSVGPTSHFKRRERLLLGNLQWVRHLTIFVFSRSPLVGFLALRRIMRMAWAWWVTICLVGICGLIITSIFPDAMTTLAGGLSTILILSALVLATWRPLRGLAQAFLVSLMMPVYLFTFRSEEVQWK